MPANPDALKKITTQVKYQVSIPWKKLQEYMLNEHQVKLPNQTIHPYCHSSGFDEALQISWWEEQT